MASSFARALTRNPGGSARVKLKPKRGISRSAELIRLLSLPRRSLDTYDEAFALALSQEMRRPGSDFLLKPKQAAMLVEVVEAGGLLGAVGVGCIRGNTKITTKDGDVPICELRAGALVLSAGQRGWRWARCNAPFVKGRARLLEVQTARGVFVAHERHLIALHDGTWKYARHLSSGDALLSCSDIQLRTISELSLSKSQLSAHRLTDIHASSSDRYSVCCRQCGQPLPLSLENGQEIAQQSNDAVKHNQFDAHALDNQTVVWQARNRRDRLDARHSTPDSSHLAVDRARDEARPSDDASSFPGTQDYNPGQLQSEQQKDRRSLVQESFLYRTAVLLGENANPQDEQHNRHALDQAAAAPLFQKLSDCRPLAVEYLREPLLCSSCLTNYYTVVTKVKQLDEVEDYWDVEIPETGNYCAEGLVHHNTGKTTIAPLFGLVTDVAPVVLLVPPAIKKELETRVIPRLAKHFDFAPPIVVSYSELSTATRGDILDRLKPALIVSDECFSGDTPVWTPQGLRSIGELQEGDAILAVAPDGSVSTERVVARRTRTAADPYNVTIGDETLKTTANHPFLNNAGYWVAAECFNEDHAVCLVQKDVQDVLQPFLRHALLSEVAHVTTGDSREGTQQKSAREDSSSARAARLDPGSNSAICRVFPSNEKQQSDARSGHAQQSVGDAQKERTQTEDTRGQRPGVDSPAIPSLVAAWMADGVRCTDESARQGISRSLQNRHRGSGVNDGCRSGRTITRLAEGANCGSKEGSAASFAWVARASRSQRASAEECARGRQVHTIEVSGPSTYLVGTSGVVVHNCHLLKNKNAARTKRFLRYFDENPKTILVALSGTIIRRSLMDFHHLVQLTHKGWKCPVTRQWREAKDWSLALDPQVQQHERLHPGALLEFCKPGEEARDGFRRRLLDTDGVIGGSAEDVGATLLFRRLRPSVPKSVEAALELLRKKWETPGGEQITDALDFARKAREISQGFYYVWDWPGGEPDEKWLAARKAWRSAVAAVCKLSRPGLDSELLVRNAAERELKQTWRTEDARLPKATRDVVVDAWRDWAEVKDQEDPPVRAVWIDDFLVRYALAWAQKAVSDGEGGLIWFDSRAVGERAEALGANVCGAGGEGNSALLSLAERREGAAPSVFVSANAHGTGKNLQRWSRNLILAPWGGGATWEQIIGRTHRPGQDADEVTADVCVHTPELFKAMESALEQARFLEDTTGGAQKLLQGMWVDA